MASNPYETLRALAEMQGGMDSYFLPLDRTAAISNDPLSAARKPIAKWLLKDEQSVSWDAVIGNDLAKAELREAIEASHTHAALYAHYAMTSPKGVLLWGGPGNGKTMLAKACATALGAIYGKKSEMIVVSGPELDSKYIGETEERVRSIFAYARAYKAHHGVPLVVFMDEADATLGQRDGRHVWRDSLVSQFLSEMDGLSANGAFFILASNRPESIDSAFLREGRIDRKIRVKRPTQEETEAIIQSLLVKAFDKNERWVRTEFSISAAIEYLYSPEHLISKVEGKSGAQHFFTLGHIVSGAMAAGLISRVKSSAFRRDIAAGTLSGVTQADWTAAIDALFEENKSVSHDYSLLEFMEDATPIEQARMEALRK